MTNWLKWNHLWWNSERRSIRLQFVPPFSNLQGPYLPSRVRKRKFRYYFFLSFLVGFWESGSSAKLFHVGGRDTDKKNTGKTKGDRAIYSGRKVININKQKEKKQNKKKLSIHQHFKLFIFWVLLPLAPPFKKVAHVVRVDCLTVASWVNLFLIGTWIS